MREMARHRLRLAVFVGVDRAAVQQGRAGQRAAQRGQAAARSVEAEMAYQDFHAFQQLRAGPLQGAA